MHPVLVDLLLYKKHIIKMELSTKYNPSEIEEKWYRYWLDGKMFHSEPDSRQPYTIVIPPPNVTGVLHMGHMLNNTIQDVLVRNARMQGKNACWVPGTDHASIATEAKVVAKLASEGIAKNDLSRDEFLRHAWEWTHRHGGIILEQLKKLGCSCDWDRTAFTMDEVRSKSVIRVFCDLYRKGLIYRGIRMVNWDPKAQTALSDEEVTYKEQQGKLYYLRYKIVSEHSQDGADEYAVVATTRPETIMGDTAMCINPNNPKTAHLRGKSVVVPLVNRTIPVIEDDYVDVEFGTGCLKVTPAHDVNDYMLGEKYNLPSIDIFNDDGTLNDNGAMYAGLDRFVCRRQIEKDLTEAGLIERIEPYTNKVGFSERTDVPIEPKLSMQWWLKMDGLAEPALEAVESDTVRFHPEKFKNTYRHWMTNIKDWCISRQLWWGHQIPAYYATQLNPPAGSLAKQVVIVAETEEEARRIADSNPDMAGGYSLRQDDDCLDTWFSSWLWPISVFDGIVNPDNKEISYYYPTNDLVTAPDIIFFWVARMIMAGYHYRGKECFGNVYFTGIVRDKLGRKMSKQLGNSPDPLDLIARYGADGVRMGLLLTAPAGNDLPFDEALCETGRNFCNKIWNAFRLVQGWQVADDTAAGGDNKAEIEWFDRLLDKTTSEIADLFSKYRLSEAVTTVYKLFWDDFCSWYLEIVKPEYGKPIDRHTYEATLYYLARLLRLLHPFMPFISEHLWHGLKDIAAERNVKIADADSLLGGDSIMNTVYDKPYCHRPSADRSIALFEKVKEIVTNVRNIRTSKNISPHEPLTLLVDDRHDSAFDHTVRKLANVSVERTADKPQGAVSFMVGNNEYSVPVGSMIDVEEERKKLEDELAYLEGFLKSVRGKLANEKFVNSAPAKVVDMERKKEADTLAKMATIEQTLKGLV